MARLLSAGVLALTVLLSAWHADATNRRHQLHTAGALPAKVPARLPVKAPAKRPVVRLPPLEVKCQAVNQNPPFRVVNCKFVSRLQVPVCVRFACTPAPGGACPAMGGTGAVQNKACSWAVTPNCTIPTPVYPTRGNTYGFGWMTTEQGPVTVSIASYTRVGFRGVACP